jgi:elongation factor Ts
MTDISATLVKQLRDKTGAGIMACRTTLVETAGDLDAAIERLREAQTTMAARREHRVTAEGLIGVAVDGDSGALVELTCETDFVARGEAFREAVAVLAQAALKVTRFTEVSMAGGEPVSELTARLSSRTGERVSLGRSARITAPGVLGSYVHNTVAPGVGTLGALVALDSGGTREVVAKWSRTIAMHVAASAPQWISPQDVPAEVVEAKRAELHAQAATSGKPAGVVERMVEGRLRKFVDEITLLRQPFVLDPDRSVGQALDDACAESGAPIVVRAFARLRAGDRPEPTA